MNNVFSHINGISSQEISLVRQREKETYVTIELYNKNDDGTDDPHTLLKGTPIKKIEGNLVSDSLNVDSESLQRRTYSCELVLTDKNLRLHDLEIGSHSDIWLDKYVRIYYGIRSMRDHKLYSWLIGTFTFVSPDYVYSDSDRTLSISCADLMADYDGTKNGQITGTNVIGEMYTTDALKLNMSYTFKINAVGSYKMKPDGSYLLGEDGLPIADSYVTMKQAIEAVCRMSGLPDGMYEVDDYFEFDKNGDTIYKTDSYGNYIDKEGNITTDKTKYIPRVSLVPYDMEFEPGQTYADIWKKLCDLYPNYEFFFDVNGKFIWRKIPTNIKERAVLNNKLIDYLLLAESHNNSFSGIYNATEVWGKSFELTLNDRYVSKEKVSYTNDVYTIQLPIIQDVAIKPEHYKRIESYINNYDKIAVYIPNSNIQSPKIIVHGILNNLAGEKVDEFDLQSDSGIEFSVYDSSGKKLASDTFIAGNTYILTYRRDLESYNVEDKKYYKINGCFVLGGQIQCYGYYVETNKNCPYAYNPEAKKQGYPCLDYLIPNRISMETDYTDDLCKNRAERMTWESCIMKDTIDLSMVIIPWLDVNQKIRYILQREDNRNNMIVETERLAEKIEREGFPEDGGDSIDLHEWVIKKFSWSSMDGVMNMTAYRFREDFEYVWNRRNI